MQTGELLTHVSGQVEGLRFAVSILGGSFEGGVAHLFRAEGTRRGLEGKIEPTSANYPVPSGIDPYAKLAEELWSLAISDPHRKPFVLETAAMRVILSIDPIAPIDAEEPIFSMVSDGARKQSLVHSKAVAGLARLLAQRADLPALAA